ncbi:hypothetical protein HHUSO_G13788 [Huso huso]|uniref:DUF4806 domain-containing protein n=1 Tax=Huso huso TaxID=61971 RepID=A0ABR0ZH03_HUSHU
MVCDVKPAVISSVLQIAYLAPTGGTTMKETVWRICDKVFSQELSKQLNWCGRGVKRGFKPMKLCKLIVQSTLSNPLLSNSTEVEAENVIKEWLRLSEDRKGGRRKREEKKQAGQARRPEVEDLC